MDTHKYNCIIIDDDEIDKLTAYSFARKYPFLNICGIFSSVAEALKIFESEHIDILFSDIDMPGVNGLEFRRNMMNIPVCVFVTALVDCAIESFELAAFDFIVKPLKHDRFNATIMRVKEYLDNKRKALLYEYSLGGDVIFIKDGHKQVKVNLHDILYLEALKDYTLVVTRAKRYCVLSQIGNLLKESNFASFIRIHRSFAVQKHLINTITAQHILVNDISLPVGRSYKYSLDFIKN